MATPAKKGKSETKITRISASDNGPAKKKLAPAVKVKPATAASIDKKAKTAKAEKRARRKIKHPFGPLLRYLKGSWYELRQVRWPDRRTTWGMTGALLLFTLFFVVVILLIDAGFSQLFKLIMGTD